MASPPPSASLGGLVGASALRRTVADTTTSYAPCPRHLRLASQVFWPEVESLSTVVQGGTREGAQPPAGSSDPRGLPCLLA